MISIALSPRQMVAVFLALRDSGGVGSPELLTTQEALHRKLCMHLSIDQFEDIESLYAKGYEFSELDSEE